MYSQAGDLHLVMDVIRSIAPNYGGRDVPYTEETSRERRDWIVA